MFEMLELIENYPAIWCVSHKDYRDKHKKNKSISEAAEILGVSEDAFCKKLHNLRSSYRRVVQLKKGKSGAGVAEVKWPFFAAMKYMYTELVSSAGGTDSVSDWNQK